jgi:hypothetical protein
LGRFKAYWARSLRPYSFEDNSGIGKQGIKLDLEHDRVIIDKQMARLLLA